MWHRLEVENSRPNYSLKKIALISGTCEHTNEQCDQSRRLGISKKHHLFTLHVKQATQPSPLNEGKILANRDTPASTGPPPMKLLPVRLLSVAWRIKAYRCQITGVLMKTKTSATASGPCRRQRKSANQ